MRWNVEVKGLELLTSSGLHSVSIPKKLYDTLVNGEGLTIEAWIATDNIAQRGPARIVSYSKDKGSRNFTLGQEGRDVIVRLRTTQTDLNGRNPEVRVEDAFTQGVPSHLVVTYDKAIERVYINGEKRLEAAISGGDFSNWDPSYPLILGNEATGNRPWRGELYLVAVYQRALLEEEVRRNFAAGWSPRSSGEGGRTTDGLVALYLFDEGTGKRVFDRSGVEPALNLEMLTGNQITGKPFLGHVASDTPVSWRTGIDFVANILIFIPLGWFSHAVWAGRYPESEKGVLLLLITGMLFSLGMESLQYFIETRHSSILDVIANTAGMGIGIMLDRRTLFIGGQEILFR